MNHIDLVKIFNTVYYKTNDIEKSLSTLKESGATQMDSLKVLKSELNLSIKEADSKIQNSITWAKNNEKALNFKDEFGAFLDNSRK